MRSNLPSHFSAMHKKLAFAAQRRRWLVHAIALSALACRPGCSKPIPLLRVGSIVFPGYELMFLARELQLLDPNQVRLVELQSNSDTVRALASGQLEAAAMTQDELMSARAEGVDLRQSNLINNITNRGTLRKKLFISSVF